MLKIGGRKFCEYCFSLISKEPCAFCGYKEADYPDDSFVLPVGSRLSDRVVIGRALGKGGFGITYSGYDMDSEKRIAVKEFFPEGTVYRSKKGNNVLPLNPEYRETFEVGKEAFLREVKLVERFWNHPNIIGVYESFQENRTAYLLMDYAAGMTLKSYVQIHGNLTEGQALGVMDEIVQALDVMHKAGVLHRDVSSNNIMLCAGGEIKLIDFGAARSVTADEDDGLTVVLKPGYTPMEQYTKRGKQGAWTDIYSLGVSIYYALTGVVIDNPYERLDKDEEFSENSYGIKEEFFNILKKCTKVKISERYSSVDELRQALSALAGSLRSEPVILTEDDLKCMRPAEHAEETVYPDMTEQAVAADETVLRKKLFGRRFFAGRIFVRIALALVIVLTLMTGILLFRYKGSRQQEITYPSAGNIAGADGVSAEETAGQNLPVPDIDRWNRSTVSDERGERVVFSREGEIPYPGILMVAARIYKEDLSQFDSDMKFTLELIPYETNLWDAEGFPAVYGIAVRVLDGAGNILDVQAYNTAINNEEFFAFDEGLDTFVFVLTRDEYERAQDYLAFAFDNALLKTVTVEAYDPSEDEIGEDALAYAFRVPGDPLNRSRNIPKSSLQSLGGDVRMTLTGIDIYLGQYVWFRPENQDGSMVPIYGENLLPAWFGDFYVIGNADENDRFCFIIKEEDIAALGDEGLYFNLYGVSFETVYIERAE